MPELPQPESDEPPQPESDGNTAVKPTSDAPREHGFAPQDLTDGRRVGEYATRYPDKVAKRSIRVEAVYLAVTLAMAPLGMFLTFTRAVPFELEPAIYDVVAHYAYSLFGGLLGGCLFSVKWLYHSVAHGTWHQDRRLWRLFTPYLSAGLAFSVVVLIESGLLAVLNPDFFRDGRSVVGLTFLIGYFSDSVVAKLAELARNLFGDSRSTSKKSVEESNTSTNSQER